MVTYAELPHSRYKLQTISQTEALGYSQNWEAVDFAGESSAIVVRRPPPVNLAANNLLSPLAGNATMGEHPK